MFLDLQVMFRFRFAKVYNEQVNDEPGNYGAGFLGLRCQILIPFLDHIYLMINSMQN